MSDLIKIQNCSIQDRTKTFVPSVSWTMKNGEAWLFTGANSGGKDFLIRAISNELDFVPNFCAGKESVAGNEGGVAKLESMYFSCFGKDVAVVSLESAARLIEEERERDESEYMDKMDPGRSGRQYICEVLGGSSKKGAPLPEIAARLETFPQVKLCGVEKILDRGLKFMSTGEIRRTLLCRALLSGAKLIILSDPFAGLDAESRKILLEFFNNIANRQISAENSNFDMPRIILSMERFSEIPESINMVLEMQDKKISFCGSRAEYEKLRNQRLFAKEKFREEEKNAFLAELEKIRENSRALTEGINNVSLGESLISFENVNVGFEEHKVLVNLNWEIKQGVHWLIRGPNGSGKTTILELITGDNMQVFRENIKLFGKRRGSGESIWDIKKQLGIVSYRLHVEYRMLGGTSLRDVIVSGFRDSIGLYGKASDYESAVALAWLKLAGFEGRENENFGSISYGEQRAILILRAAVKNPRVLILDEPCHGLDEDYRQKILDLLETIAQTGTTTLLHVTHDPEEVLSCEHHILELHPGEDPMFRILEK